MPLQPEVLALPGGSARVAWRRSARARQVSLRIDPSDGAVVVTLPPRSRRAAGMALLVKHADWVVDRLAALPPASRFENGAVVPLNGRDHVIRHRPGPACVWAARGVIHVGGAAEEIAEQVVAFLRGEAQRRLSALVAEKAARVGRTPRRVVMKDTKTRWGSCAPDRSIAFNWRVVMAPPFVQDYVAAHEAVHLRHMHHGALFWADVARLTPHCSAAVAWLSREGGRLLREGRGG